MLFQQDRKFFSFWSGITTLLQKESGNQAIKHLPEMDHVISARLKFHRLKGQD